MPTVVLGDRNHGIATYLLGTWFCFGPKLQGVYLDTRNGVSRCSIACRAIDRRCVDFGFRRSDCCNLFAIWLHARILRLRPRLI
jgi:hypothetical protein